MTFAVTTTYENSQWRHLIDSATCGYFRRSTLSCSNRMGWALRFRPGNTKLSRPK